MSDEVKVEEKKKPGRPKKVENQETLKVSVDTSIEDIVEWDEKGGALAFADTSEEFLYLEDEVVQGLGHENKGRYFIALGQYMHEQKQKDKPKPIDGFRVDPRLASATARLEPENRDPRFHYCWKRPDQLRQAVQQGYEVVNDQSISTLGHKGSSTHTVSAYGDDELVLMKIPKELAEERQRVKSQRSKDKINSFDEAAASQLDEVGKSYRPQGVQRGGPNFTPVPKGS